MGKTIKVGHWYNCGDLITILPGLKHLYETQGIMAEIYQKIDFPVSYYPEARHPVKGGNDEHVSMNQEMFDMMWPLIKEQEYIESFSVWSGEPVDWDMKETRDRSFCPIPYSDIHYWPFYIFPEMACDLTGPWIDVATNHNFIDKIIINRTERYNNPYINYGFLKKYEDQLLFAGTPEERTIFGNETGIFLPILEIRDFRDLAVRIQSCKLFIGNQSFCWHLADAMKVPRILEVCKEFPNTLPTGANGYAFVYQEALEFYVDKLMQ